MTATPDMAGDSSTTDRTVGEDPTIFESLAKGPDQRVLMSEQDPLNDDIRRGYVNDKLFRKIVKNPEDHTGFQIRDDFIWMKNCGGEDVLCIPTATSSGSTLHGRIIEQAHCIVGHFGPMKTSEYVRCWYWWPRLQYEIEKYCDSCESCIRSKGEYQPPRGKLHSLPTPVRPWESIGMDFVGPFPKSDGFDYLWVIICRLSSMVHLVPVNMTTTASQLSPIFVKEIVHLHRLPGSIACDQDSKFMSKWWREVNRILGVKILMSLSFHPQTDGITERANHLIAQILRAFVAASQMDWVQFLSLVEFAINSTINRAMGMAPFEVNYRFIPHMMQELPALKCIPPGVRTFALNALHNMAVAHDNIIAE
jgi:Integrase zinc binding domain